MPDDICCIDTSSVIALNRYRRRSFPGVWREMENLVSAGRLVAPREVFKELILGTDELVSWARKNRMMFRKMDRDQITLVKDIVARFPDRFDLEKETPEADPFVVALAVVLQRSDMFSPKCVVITEEGKNKLPFIAKHYGIESIPLLDLFEREEWEFG